MPTADLAPRGTGILLAAGSGSRMGADKLQLPVAGVPLVVRALQPLLQCPDLAEVVVVTRPGVRLPLPAGGWRAVENPRAAEGMGTSLAAGAAAVPPDTAFVLVSLGDLPGLDAALLGELVAAFRASGAEALVPCFRGRRGHPVLFHPGWLPDLCALSGDRGARDLLAARADRVRFLEVDHPGVVADVDTLRDLEAAGG